MTTSFDQFTGKELIYSGSQSLIYRTFDKATNKNLIIKTLKKNSPTLREHARFNYEFEIAKSLSLDGTVEVYAIGQYQQSFAIVMEDFGGKALSSLLNHKPVSLSFFLNIAIRLVEILGQIHEKGVIHKNLNASNIVYNPDSHILKIIDFGISSTLPRETPQISSPKELEGTLAYISPEQTGRMNRTIDYRTDYYSLGATLYEMATGHPPFTSDDPITLVHCHLAKIPTPVHEINPEIPPILSEIIMKLMAKKPEDRYQSITGIKFDLQVCQDQLTAKKSIDFFDIAQQDISLRFQIPEKLYGRQEEIQKLLHSFEKAAQGNAELLMVAGNSGIGKSALVHEVHKPIILKRGYFISGKYDQYKRDIPYSAIIEAFEELIRQILTEGEESILDWKHRIVGSLKETVNVITDMIPNLEKIIGPQQKLEELGPYETQNRFNLVFQNIMQIFASSKHPLTLFLDDLQWADVPSLNLIKLIFQGKMVNHFFFIGSYRDNEVTETHPLMLALSEIEKTDIRYHTLTLPPLRKEHLNHILIDTLHENKQTVEPLTEVCFEITEGNPFFLNQLLMWIHQENLIEFNHNLKKWTWDVDKIKSAAIDLNITDLMKKKISNLSEQSQTILALASCIGNWFDIQTLSIAHGKPIYETSEDLIESLREGLIIPEDNSYRYIVEKTDTAIPYRFMHDRVQQAAYALIPEKKKLAIHEQIGNLLLVGASDEAIRENVFTIVTHLNYALPLISKDNDLINLAKLNLIAGKKAKASTAFNSAADYLKIAKEILPKNKWDTHFDLSFEISRECAICLYISGMIAPADAILQDLLLRARTDLEKAEVAWTLTTLYTTTRQMDKAIDAGIYGLKLLGVDVPKYPSKFGIFKAIFMTKWNLGKRRIADLINEPPIADRKHQLQLELMLALFPNAYLTGNFDLLTLSCLNQVNIVLKHGNAPAAAPAFVTYALILGSYLNELENAYEYGKLAIEVSERYPDIRTKCRTVFLYGIFIHHWNHHRKELEAIFKKSIDYGVESGDLLYRSYSCRNVVLYNPNMPLEKVLKEGNKYLQLIHQAKDYDCWDMTKVHLQMIAALLGKTEGERSLSDQHFDENACLVRMKKGHVITGIAIYYYCKMFINFMFEKNTLALNYLHEVDKNIHGLISTPYISDHSLYAFLVYSALYPELQYSEKRKAWKRMKKEWKQTVKWATHCPINFSHNQLIMEAEFARLSGKIETAGELYDRAIEEAIKNEYLQTQALANELAAKFYLQNQQPDRVKKYLKEAIRCYTQWGAKTKVNYLEKIGQK